MEVFFVRDYETSQSSGDVDAATDRTRVAE